MHGVDLSEELLRGLRRHPRVSWQKLVENGREQIADALPVFVPFRGTGYASALWVLDWDHRLPSQDLVLRLYAYYGEQSCQAGLRSFEEREQHIAREDLFPEFDVPDFSGLVADEAYAAELPPGGPPKTFRLVSDWRREVEPLLGRKAEEIVRRSHPFQELASQTLQELASQTRARLPGLGDLEAAEWSSPPESGHARWGLDVWYLRSFNGMIGEATAFLVDIEDEKVVGQRDFQFRAG